ncbi:uncharacterized protein LOC129760638 [Uranotaenia lowii]|uniref:uncharacterized protein LOC129760638 n=1 Tax=Uranotaenia lowii TaxID=190385 RepID=UPI00247B08D0|nr:uncharacterized protein LOC129760638 [Uranotaenia lowii]
MDEDVEFRDMVYKKLEESGMLLDIKAKLRTYLYDIIENDGKSADSGQPETAPSSESEATFSSSCGVVEQSETVNPEQKTSQTEDQSQRQAEEDDDALPMDNRSLALGLVLDLLDCMKLSYSKTVLLAETGKKGPSRKRLLQQLAMPGEDQDLNDAGQCPEPLLYQLIEGYRKAESSCADSSSNSSSISSNASTNNNSNSSGEEPSPGSKKEPSESVQENISAT